MSRKRLDILLVDRGLCRSRSEAQSLILSGVVWSGQQRLDKAGTLTKLDLPIEVKEKSRFVSRAGEKLASILEAHPIPVRDKVCIDVGASTGGFTDCLLQKGARQVFAVDVGYGQLDMNLRNDPRVVAMERTNARQLTLDQLMEASPHARQIDLLVMDVSFISIQKILEPLHKELKEITHWVLLFKPQFEVGRKFIGRGGLVRSQEAVEEALNHFGSWVSELGFTIEIGPSESPVPGKKSGNIEYLWYLKR